MSVRELMCHNAPAPLLPLARAWQAQGRSFYLGPENIFQFNSGPMSYHGAEAVSRDWGAWHVCTADCRGPMRDLTRQDLEDIAAVFMRETSRPRSAHLYVDSKCNLRCFMCPYFGDEQDRYWANHASLDVTLTLDEAKQRVDTLAAIGIRQIAVESIGDIFAYKHWKELVGHSKSRMEHVHLVTNGIRLHDNHCKLLGTLGVDSVTISINAVTHDTWKAVMNSTSEKSFEIVKEAPRLLKKYGIPQVTVSYVYGDRNMAEVKPFLDHWMTGPADLIRLVKLIPEAGRDSCHSPQQVQAEQTRNLQEPMGTCSDSCGDLLIMPNGRILPCCGAVAAIDDANSSGLPVWTIHDDIEQVFARLRSSWFDDPAWRKVCAGCPVHTRLGAMHPVRVHGYVGEQYGITTTFEVQRQSKPSRILKRLGQEAKAAIEAEYPAAYAQGRGAKRLLNKLRVLR